VIRTLPPSVRDGALLVARLLLGVVLIAHGWQKVVTNGLGGTAEAFTRMGVPAAPVSAAYAGIVELVGGALLLVGAATAVVGVLVVLDMLGAAALVLAAVGAGRYSVDHALGARRTPAEV
jgi:putative oxidoreductase